MVVHNSLTLSRNDEVITEICSLNWTNLTAQEMISVAWAYYFFSVQFRENLCIACELFPDDPALKRLFAEECDTANLSPYPGIAEPGEKMNHDEFMRRTLECHRLPEETERSFKTAGARYMHSVKSIPRIVRALSMASYEDGGLERLFKAMLTAPHYDNALLNAFRFFLSEHIRFDSDPVAGHGSLSRHLEADDSVAELWQLFRELLIETTPKLLDKAGEEHVHALI